jgi:hypothetical protein
MTKQKQLVICMQMYGGKKQNKYYINISFQTLFSVLVETPLAAITASSRLGYDATSFAHLYLGSFPHSLQILSNSVRLESLHSYFQVSPEMCSFSISPVGFLKEKTSTPMSKIIKQIHHSKYYTDVLNNTTVNIQFNTICKNPTFITSLFYIF